jgi:hypothetical protein
MKTLLEVIQEVARREAEIDAGTADFLTHEQLCKAVGR